MTKDIGPNFVDAALTSLEQDTDVNWRPRIPQWPAVGDTMATAIQSALVGQKKSKEALDEAQTRIDQILKANERRRCRIHRRTPQSSMAAAVRTLAQQERRFALALFLPALLLLILTTTTPLVYLAWTSLQQIDLSMPWLSGFAGVANYTKMASDPRFWSS